MESFIFVAVFGVMFIGCSFAFEINHYTGCASAGLCCEQVNNTCFVSNARKIDGTVGNCFCDSKCLQMQDCCVDFEDACKGR